MPKGCESPSGKLHAQTHSLPHTETHTLSDTHTVLLRHTHTQSMLEVQEERPATAGGTAATHFSKKERGKKEREEAKDSRGNLGNIGNSIPGSGGRGNGRGKAPHTHTGSPHQLITPPCSVVLGAPSIHHNRLKNSPSTNTQR